MENIMKKNLISSLITVLIILSAGVTFEGCKKESSKDEDQTTTESNTKPENKSAEKNTSNKSTLYYFYGTGCSNCKKTVVIIDSLEKKYNLKVVRYEVWHSDENRALLIEMGKQINYEPKGVPLVIFMKKAYFGINSIMEVEADIIKLPKTKS